jgi:pimeloyl-ACP methyl ester carboxylesterase/DNA-binding CsgD family transcriptional regulator
MAVTPAAPRVAVTGVVAGHVVVSMAAEAADRLVGGMSDGQGWLLLSSEWVLRFVAHYHDISSYFVLSSCFEGSRSRRSRGGARTMSGMASEVRSRAEPPAQEIRFCRAQDGIRLAYTMHGSGPPLVNVACWLSHLQFDWQSPVWRHLIRDLGAFRTLVRFDERGSGLSDWNVTDFSLEARVHDLETVIDTTGLHRTALLGMSQGGQVAISYAARHPERVSHLILLGAWARSAAGWTQEQIDEEAAYRALIKAGWARPDPVFRHVFTTMFIPDADEEQMRWFDDLQRLSTSTENMLASRAARIQGDVWDLLPDLTTPTLVLHGRGDVNVPFDEASDMAARIPGARLVPLETRNHVLLPDDPAWAVFLREVQAFLDEPRTDPAASTADDRVAQLSDREREVLELAASGTGNAGIAASLGLSVRTVERHLSNAYIKLGISGRTARTAAVASLLRRRPD